MLLSAPVDGRGTLSEFEPKPAAPDATRECRDAQAAIARLYCVHRSSFATRFIVGGDRREKKWRGSAAALSGGRTARANNSGEKCKVRHHIVCGSVVVKVINVRALQRPGGDMAVNAVTRITQ